MSQDIDLNSAAPAEIEMHCSLEPYTVKSLIRHRPLKDYDQLEKLPGMGPLHVITMRLHGCVIAAASGTLEANT